MYKRNNFHDQTKSVKYPFTHLFSLNTISPIPPSIVSSRPLHPHPSYPSLRDRHFSNINASWRGVTRAAIPLPIITRAPADHPNFQSHAERLGKKGVWHLTENPKTFGWKLSKWNSNFPENSIGNCELRFEVVLSFRCGTISRKILYHLSIFSHPSIESYDRKTNFKW